MGNYALRLKFKTYYNLIKEYVDSKIPIYFVEHTKNDRQWADGNDGKGTNYLGKLLTTLCWEYRLIKDKKSGKDKDDENKDNDDNDGDDGSTDMNWTIDTMSDAFLKWMDEDNIDVIQNGDKFYEKNSECGWLK